MSHTVHIELPKVTIDKIAKVDNIIVAKAATVIMLMTLDLTAKKLQLFPTFARIIFDFLTEHKK